MCLNILKNSIKILEDYSLKTCFLSKKKPFSLIESYLKTLINTNNKLSENDIKISPFVKSMQTGVKILYGDYLAKKSFHDFCDWTFLFNE